MGENPTLLMGDFPQPFRLAHSIPLTFNHGCSARSVQYRSRHGSESQELGKPQRAVSLESRLRNLEQALASVNTAIKALENFRDILETRELRVPAKVVTRVS